MLTEPSVLTESSPEPTPRHRFRSSVETLLGRSADQTLRLSTDLKSEQAKVDSLQQLLMQREMQKQAFFLQSLKKEEECLRLREQLLRLQSQEVTPSTHTAPSQTRIQELEKQLARARLLPLLLAVLLLFALLL